MSGCRLFAQSTYNAVSTPLQVFTLEIEGRPTLAFEAADLAEAQQICADADLRADLCGLTSDGTPVCTTAAILLTRPASEAEISAFQRALHLAPASDEPTMAFLINVDGVMVVSMDPE